MGNCPKGTCPKGNCPKGVLGRLAEGMCPIMGSCPEGSRGSFPLW